MIFKKTILRKISDEKFQEAEPPSDRSRPLEWRRRFNFISIPLKNIELIDQHSVHDIEFKFDDEKVERQADLVKPNLGSQYMIRGFLDQKHFRDYIYLAVETNEQGAYSIEKVTGDLFLELTGRTPTEDSEYSPAGLYWGNAYSSESEGERDLSFSLSIPPDHMQSIRDALDKNESAIITVDARLLSFTYEVDDFLRRPFDPRDILVLNSNLCFVDRVSVSSRIGPQKVPVPPVDDSENTVAECTEELTVEEVNSRELIAALVKFKENSDHLVKAVWFLVAVIVVNYFI